MELKKISMLKYNVKTEVSENQYNILKTQAAGIIAHKKENGKFYIKLWLPKYRDFVNNILNTVK